MDERFRPAFVNTIESLTADEPFRTLDARIREAEGAILVPSHTLRHDARLFLLINIGYLIVKPWDQTMTHDPFLTDHGSELNNDVREILEEGKLLAQQRLETEISANLMLQVVAHRRRGVRTRGLNIWGP
jgi:hypothetical protein